MVLVTCLAGSYVSDQELVEAYEVFGERHHITMKGKIKGGRNHGPDEV